MTMVFLGLADVLAVLLLALPFVNPFSWVVSAIFTRTEAWLLTACVAPFLLAWLSARGWRVALRIMVAGCVLAAAVNSVIGLMQYFGVAVVIAPWAAPAPVGVASGNIRQTNLLATLQVIALLALVWVWRGRAKDGAGIFRPGLVGAALGLLAVLLLAGLAATASRIGMLELVVAVLATAAYTGSGAPAASHARRRLLGRPFVRVLVVGGVAFLCYFLLVVLLPLTLHDVDGMQGRSLVGRWAHAEQSCNSRFVLYSNVLHLISLKPWTGWGWGNLAWANFVTLYDGPRMCSSWMDNAHDLPLHLAVTLGIPAATVICLAILYAIWRGQPWRERRPAQQWAWCVLLVVGLHSLVEFPLWYGPIQVVVIFCIALLWFTRPAAQAAQKSGDLPGSRWRVVATCNALSVVMLLAAGYATWDYWRVSQIFILEWQRASWWREDPVTPALKSWLFADQARFGLVLGSEVTPENAAQFLPMAILGAHFGPMAEVVGKIVESAALLGDDAMARAYLTRFELAMPNDYQTWAERHASLVARLRGAPVPAAGGAMRGDGGMGIGLENFRLN